MIEINLLPDEFKVQVKEKTPASAADIKRFLFILPVAAVVLVCVHIYLAANNISKNSRLRALTKEWQSMAPQKKDLDDFNKNYSASSDEIKTAQKLTENRIDWSRKLDKLSRDLPAGIWFKGLFIKSGQFNLEGSVISLQNDEMGLIRDFMDALKNDAEFFKGFDNLELGSVQSKAVGSYNVIDFVLSAKLKAQ